VLAGEGERRKKSMAAERSGNVAVIDEGTLLRLLSEN